MWRIETLQLVLRDPGPVFFFRCHVTLISSRYQGGARPFVSAFSGVQCLAGQWSCDCWWRTLICPQLSSSVALYPCKFWGHPLLPSLVHLELSCGVWNARGALLRFSLLSISPSALNSVSFLDGRRRVTRSCLCACT